jgi:predicted esterase
MQIWLLLLLLPQDKASAAKEAELKRVLANEWAALAEWCAGKKLPAEAKAHAKEALDLVPDHAKAKAVKTDGEADEAARADYEKKLDATGKKVAKWYRELAFVKHAPADQPRYDVYLIRALELDVKGTEKIFEAEWKAAWGKKELDRAHRLLSASERVKPDEKNAKVLREVEYKAAEARPILRQAKAHKMQYHLALPKGWSAARTWPIVVTVEGAGCNWLGNCNAFLGQRGDRPFILVTPITFANTNALDPKKYPYPQELLDEVEKSGRIKFDEEGLLAVLEEVRKDFNGQEKFFITGFSGGGNLTWRMIFGHPDKLAGASPACANFYMTGTVSQAPERETLPVKALQGDKDEYLNQPPNLEQQWLKAKQLCDENGFKNVSRVMLPGVGHSACGKEVLDFFASLLPKK